VGQVLHGRATTTHAIRAAIQRSKASLQALIERYGINPKTVAKWRRRTSLAGIYGLEESGGVTALVMELVEGDDLSQRIARGAIPLDEALPIAKQIAEALEAAHAQGSSIAT
jgi:serine/threonine protein kinase